MQINIGHLDENGIYNGQTTTYALSGFVRGMARARDGISAELAGAGGAPERAIVWRNVTASANRMPFFYVPYLRGVNRIPW